jgi:mono/diheme cytochrome c family protein
LLSNSGATTDKGEIMNDILKVVMVMVLFAATGIVSGCGGGSGGSTGSLTPTSATASGTQASASGAQAAPPAAAVDGAALYAADCSGCHGALATSSKKGATLARLQAAIAGNTGGMGFLSALSAAEQQAIVNVLTPASTTPTTPPATDGVALYAANCAGCHGALASSAKAGRSAAQIQAAITNNTGGMGFLSTLTATQVGAIATALAPVTPPPPPPPTTTVDGATLYANNCASCHGPLATSAKAGRTAAQIQAAINNNTGGMGFLSTLTATQVGAIATSLAGVTAPPTPPPACGSCHAIPPATGQHAFHNGQGIVCATCHGTGYSSTTVNAATHNNGVKNLTTTLKWNATARSCSPSCHGTRSW